MFLISDTNASIKLSAFGNKFFKQGAIIDELGACDKIGKTELKGLQRTVKDAELKKCIDVALKELDFYEFTAYNSYEFWDYLANFYTPAEEIVCKEMILGGSCDNDKYFMHLAVIYDYILITNDLPLYHLAKKVKQMNQVPDMDEFDVVTVEDLVLKAFDEGKLNKEEIKQAIKIWNSTQRSVLKIKRQEFIKRKLI